MTGREEVAGAAVRVRARSCFGARGGRRRRGCSGGLGRTGAGPAGLPGERQVSPGGFSLSGFLFINVFYFLQFVLI